MAREDRNPLYATNPSGSMLKGVDLSRVAEAVKFDRQALRPFRQRRMYFIKQLVGNFYGNEGTGYDVPLPLISTYVSIQSRALVPKEPRVSLSTFDAEMAPAVDAMERWLNDWFEEVELGHTLRRATIDALLSEAHVKVSIMMPEVAESGYGGKAGQPYICLIDEDDWVCDMRARDEKEMAYWGHRVRLPLEVARDIFRKDMKETDPEQVDESGESKVFTISSGSNHRDEIEPYTYLWEVHLRRKGLILTLRDDNGLPGGTKKDVLRVRKYLGPKAGNVFNLSFETVPGNLRGKSPVMGLMPLHLAINRSYRKLIDTADNYKSVTTVPGSAMSTDGKQVKEARHMQVITSDRPDAIGEKRFNLPPPELQLFAADMRNAFNFIGGGLATLGGREAMSGTATQEKILNANANAGVSDMQGTELAFVSRVIKTACWYLWNHPEDDYETIKPIPGLPNEQPLQRRLYAYNDQLPSHEELVKNRAMMRKGPMPRIKVDPFSLSHLSPGERSQFISAVMAELAPYAAILAEQGVYLDVQELVKLKAKYGDEPDLLKVYKFQGKPEPSPQEQAMGMMGEGMGGGMGGGGAGLNKEISAKPPQTERTYNRISSGGSQRDSMADMQRQLMSAAGSQE